MKKRTYIISIVILFIISVLITYKWYTQAPTSITKLPTNITISAESLFENYEEDEIVSNLKYLDKVIEVNGVVSGIAFQKNSVTLKTKDDFGSILCGLSKEFRSTINTLKVGQRVIIKGICSGYLMDVVLIRCEIINLKKQ